MGEFKGYIFRITGGNDKQGFPMKQGVLTNGRVKLLFKKGMSCFRERRSGTRKRKSVRGCIVGNDLATLQLVIAKKGPEDVPGLTDDNRPRRLGPKRAANIRKLFNLEKKDDVKLLFKKGMSCFRERRKGARKRKSARGCIVGPDLATLQLSIARKGAEDIPGLTDDNRPRRLGPKRAA